MKKTAKGGRSNHIVVRDKDNWISITGYCVYFTGCLISWKSHAQTKVTLSSTAAEYIAISKLCLEILFI